MKDYFVPEWMRGHIVAVSLISVSGRLYSYLVLKKEAGQPLPGFVGQDKGLPFISEEVPSEFRGFVLAHEIIEFGELAGTGNRCAEALHRELVLVPPLIRESYVKYRRQFFERFVKFAREKPGVSTWQNLSPRWRKVWSGFVC